MCIRDRNYGVLIIDSLTDIPVRAKPSLKILAANGRLFINKHSDYSSIFEGAVVYDTPDNLTDAIKLKIKPDISLFPPSDDIRYRHVIKGNSHFYLIFNEGSKNVSTKLDLAVGGSWQLLNPYTAAAANLKTNENISLKPH